MTRIGVGIQRLVQRWLMTGEGGLEQLTTVRRRARLVLVVFGNAAVLRTTAHSVHKKDTTKGRTAELPCQT